MTVAAHGSSPGFEAWSLKAGAGDGPKLMGEIMTRAERAGVEVLVLDGLMVFGKDHLRSALEHATRAICEGTNSSESRLMETLLYASGERQLSAAIKKMSVSGRTDVMVVARLTEGRFGPEPSWTPLPDRPAEIETERLLRFGVTHAELGTVALERALELVLEKVAAVDVLKR